MALNPSTNASMTGRVTAPDANYPYASSKDESSPGAGDGSPYFKGRADDIFGFQQALLKAAGIVPSGNADTAVLSEYMQSLVEIASGRAVNYDESGLVNAYVLDVKTDQQGPRSYFEGLTVVLYPTNTNTGASTVNVNGLGLKNITDTASGGELPAGTRIELVYNSTSGEFEIIASAAEPVTAGHIFGLILSNAADTDHDIFFDVGICADSTNLFNLELGTALTKQIDAAWLAGDNVGGLFTGVVAIDTWYHCFLIQKDSDGSIDCGFDTSVTAANIPAGYTAYKWIGAVLTDGAANILPFIHNANKPNRFKLVVPLQDLSGAAPIGSRTTLTLSTPLGIKVNAIIHNKISSTASAVVTLTVSNLAVPDVASSTTNATDINYRNTTGFSSGGFVEVMTNTASQVGYRGSHANGSVIVMHEWEVERGSV